MSFYLNRNKKFQKNSKKIQKIKKKKHYGFFSSQDRLGKAEKERKQKKSFRWVPNRPLIKKFKKLEITFIASFKPK